MKTVQIGIDEELLRAVDRAARRTKRNRSALVRGALRERLRSLEVRAREERDHEDYARQRQAQDESHLWEAEATWRHKTLLEMVGKARDPTEFRAHERNLRRVALLAGPRYQSAVVVDPVLVRPEVEKRRSP